MPDEAGFLVTPNPLHTKLQIHLLGPAICLSDICLPEKKETFVLVAYCLHYFRTSDCLITCVLFNRYDSTRNGHDYSRSPRRDNTSSYAKGYA